VSRPETSGRGSAAGRWQDLGENMAPSRVGLTPLRRGVGAALVVLLLLGAIVYYWRAQTSPSLAATGPTAAASASPSAAVDASPPTATPTPTPGVGGQSASVPPEPSIEVYEGNAISAAPFETVPIRGTYHRGADTFVRAERREGARWVAYPLSAKTDRVGRFVIHIEFGASGPYWVRVVDPKTKLASREFVVAVAGR
jgi:hypothetical protein